jgi:serine protease Do
MRTSILSALLVAALGGGLAVAGPSQSPSNPPSHVQAMSKGRLGFAALPMSDQLRAHFGAPDDRGVLVNVVRPDSPASRAGLQVGDVVTDVAGAPATSTADIIATLADHKKGESVTIAAIRDGKHLELHARLETDPQSDASNPTPFPNGFERWFDSHGDMPDMREMFQHMQRHMHELEQQQQQQRITPNAPSSERI